MLIKGNCLFYALLWRCCKCGTKLKYIPPNWRKGWRWGHWDVKLPSGRCAGFWGPNDLGPLEQFWFEGEIKVWGSKDK